MRLFHLTFAASLAVVSIANTAAQDFNQAAVAAMETLADEQANADLFPDFRINTAKAYFNVLTDNPDYYKVTFLDVNDFVNFAAWLRLVDFPEPVQALYNGVRVQGEPRLGPCCLGYYYENGEFVANNLESADLLMRSPAVNAWWFDRADVSYLPVYTETASRFTTLAPPTTGAQPKPPLVLIIRPSTDPEKGTKCADMLLKKGGSDPTVEGNTAAQELCIYIYYSQLAAEKAGGLTTISDAGVPKTADDCSKKWRDLVRKACADDVKDKDVGHMPDVCAGGHPNQHGCFLPMSPSCNRSLGAACRVAVGNPAGPNDKPMATGNGGMPIKWCKIVIKYGSDKTPDNQLAVLDCKFTDPQNPPGYLKKAVEDMKARKKKFAEWNCKNQDDPLIKAMLAACGKYDQSLEAQAKILTPKEWCDMLTKEAAEAPETLTPKPTPLR
jgi:hypothetical protein